MSRRKHHKRSAGSERSSGGERGRTGEPVGRVLARVFDRIRAWFGGMGGVRMLRCEAARMTHAVREQARAVLGGSSHRRASEARRRGGEPHRRRRRFVPEAYPMGAVPGPQPWPWRFTGHGVPWAPGPQSYHPSFMSLHPQGQSRPGPFVGRGPRNYSRSDERIVEDIHEVLTYSPQIDASDIEVRVERGEVTVFGSVDDRYTRRLVEDLIHDVPGVRDLQNRLRVAPRDLHGAGGLHGAHGGSELFRVRRDITAGRDLDDAESAGSNLNAGDERGQDEHESPSQGRL